MVLVGLPAIVSAGAVVLSRLVPAWNDGAWDVAWTAGAVCALDGMLLARRAAGDAERRRWSLWALAALCWLAGQLIWDLFGLIGFPQSPNPADVGWWAFAVIVIFSLMRRPAPSRSVRIVNLVEVLPLIAAAIALSFGELWHAASVSSLALAPKVSALVYPALYIAAAVLMLQAMIAGSLRGSRSVALRLVLGGMAAQALAFALWSKQLLDMSYVPGRTLLDPLWIAGLVMMGVGGALAARRSEEIVELKEPDQRGGMLPALVFVLLIAALVHALVAHAPAGSSVTLGIGLLFCGSALTIRGNLLERRLRVMLERERAALGVAAEREVELARLNAQLVEDSRHDPLTGMRNRRALADDLLQLEAARQEPGRSFAVALCDVDHFKAYNDCLGHMSGDQALRAISGAVAGSVRPGDRVYRFGGEELLLILDDVTEQDAIAIAQRVRLAVKKLAIDHPRGVDGVLTASLGLAVGDQEFGSLLGRADAALYQAKRAGRNCVWAAAADEVPVDGRRHGATEEPVPRHLRGMLTVSRAAAAGQGPTAVLEALAETIRSELFFNVVAVNLLDPDRQNLRCVIVLGDADARETLLGTTSPWSEWEPLMDSQHSRCGALWLPAGSHEWEGETMLWTPQHTPVLGTDGWDPRDMLLLPLRGQAGDVIGMVSVDQPVTGRRPDDSQIIVLMSVADHAALAVEQTLRDSARAEAAVEQSAELRLAAVMVLAETLDLRDPGTGRHSRTVGIFAQQAATALGLPPERVERIHAAGVLHDLGKLGIADAILYKSGKLDESEWREIERHPEVGAQILEHAGLFDIAHWVRSHHERLDGLGYPSRLPAEAIPLEARILAVADAYEAMIADRPYRAGMPPEAARAELRRCSGTQFDGEVVEAFIRTLSAGAFAGTEVVPEAA